MSDRNLLALFAAMSIAQSVRDQFPPIVADFQQTLQDVLDLVGGLRTQPVTPEAVAAFEKNSLTG